MLVCPDLKMTPIDDVKTFLRAVLVSSAGVQQSKLCKYYEDLTGQTLPWRDLGYASLFGFIKSLEGEVARVEFNEKVQDNIVYAVLDKTKFASKHAESYAAKSVTGIPGKSPEEIAEWKASFSCRLSTDTEKATHFSKPNHSKSPRRGRKNPGNMSSSAKSQFGHCQLPSRCVSVWPPQKGCDWSYLAGLQPSLSMLYTLHVQSKAKSLSLTQKHFMTLFLKFKPEQKIAFVVNKRNDRVAFVRFQQYAMAFRAWRALDGVTYCGEQIQVKPAKQKVSMLGMGRNPVYELSMAKIPTGISMSDLVEPFLNFKGLMHICIDIAKREALVRFFDKASCELACEKVNAIVSKGVSHPVALRFLGCIRNKGTKGYAKPFIKSAVPDMPRVSYQSPTEADWSESDAGHAEDSEQALPSSDQVGPAEVGLSDSESSVSDVMHADIELGERRELSIQDTSFGPSGEKAGPDLEACSGLVCGFSLDFTEYSRMFERTCDGNGRCLVFPDFPDEVVLLVTYVVDACRFWAVILDDKEASYKKLQSIESAIHDMAQRPLSQSSMSTPESSLSTPESSLSTPESSRSTPGSSLPAPGTLGAALYHENQTWYRCNVVSVDVDKDQIKVFFCDYGNMEVVSGENFRQTDMDAWMLPPQAVPCKLWGIENKSLNVDPGGVEYLVRVFESKCWKATVVKDGNRYSQPHVMELERLVCLASNVSMPRELLVEDVLCAGFTVRLGERSESGPTSQSGNEIGDDEGMPSSSDFLDSETASVDCDDDIEQEVGDVRLEIEMVGLFDYDEKSLKTGLISEVHSVDLLFLQLSVSGLTALENLLCAFVPEVPATLVKDRVVMYFHDGWIRRVRVLAVHPTGSKAKVLHIDYGRIHWVDTRYLYEIPEHLRTLRWQARPAMLAGISVECVPQDSECVEMILSKAKTPVRINVIEEFAGGKVLVELFEMGGGASINRQLLEGGLVVSSKTNSLSLSRDLSASLVSLAVSEASSNRSSSSKSANGSSVSWSESSPEDSVSWSETAITKLPRGVEKEHACTKSPDICNFRIDSRSPVATVCEPDVLICGNDIKVGRGPDELVLKGVLDRASATVNRRAMLDVRHGWEKEKARLQAFLARLEGLRNMEDELDRLSALKEMKKRKLDLKISIQEMEQRIRNREAENRLLTAEIETLLATI